MWHVLEHIYDLDYFLKELNYLKKMVFWLSPFQIVIHMTLTMEKIGMHMTYLFMFLILEKKILKTFQIFWSKARGRQAIIF